MKNTYKQELVNKIATERASKKGTFEEWQRVLNKMLTKELELIVKRNNL